MAFWFRHVAVLILILIIIVSLLNANLDVEDGDVSQDLSDSGDGFLVFVSNLDGSVSALDGRTGEVKWSVSTGVRPLLLSSISDIQMNRNGQPSRLVPSLDGSLYQMDGEGIEPLPLAADLLLTSTYKLTDEASIVGGKEIETYGIDVNTGKLRYVCSSENCRQATDLGEGQKYESNEVLVVKRTDRTIRLVDVMEGHEKWNFSVGQLDLSYHIRSDPSVIGGLIQEAKQEEGESFQGSENPRFNFLKRDDISVKVKMPTRTVTAVDRNDPSDILWEHQFDTSIAGAWMMKGHELYPISLFDEQNFSDSDKLIGQGMMYIGVYNDMLYIQPSDVFFENRVAQDDDDDDNADDGKQVQVYMPRVRWKPYIATAPSRTPIIVNQNPRNSGLKVDSANSFSNAFLKDKSLALLSKNQYPFDSGYYLYLVHTPIEDFGSCQNTTKIPKRIKFITALSRKWKEVSLFLFLGVASLFSFLRKKFNRSFKNAEPSVSSAHTPELTSKSCSAQHDLLMPESGFRRDSSKEEVFDTSQQFVSRYLTDFQQQECLGKGGFGVVFKAYNRIDECSYAVKRIELKDSKTARDKVMREVKALAKLDHPGIVRYYQSWLECPPLGWQERYDSLICPSESIETSMTSNLTSEVQRSSEIPNFSVRKEVQTDSSGGIVFTNDVRVDVRTTSEDNDCCGDSVAITMEDSSWDGDSGRSTNEMVGDHENGFDTESIVFEGSESFCMIESPNHDSLRRRNIASSQGSSIEFLVNSEHPGASSGKETPEYRKDHKPTPKRGSRVSHDSKKLENNLNHDEGSSATPGESPRKLYLYIQMQLCRPESLREWLNDQPFEREATYDIFYQIVSAISYVHVQGLMHRDLKPSNIFFAMDGTIKIGDFGLVTDVENMCDVNNSPTKNLSVKVPNGKRHTNQVGTQLYMSPELSSGQNYTHKVDIYALGVIFFEMFQRFSTQMERVTSLKQLRELKFPASFLEKFRDEHEFVEPLLSHDPSARPEACDLLKHKLLSNYEESSNLFRRLHRTRTLSMHSNSSSSQGIAVSPTL